MISQNLIIGCISLLIGFSSAFMLQEHRVTKAKNQYTTLKVNLDNLDRISKEEKIKREALYDKSKKETEDNYKSDIASLTATVNELRKQNTARKFVPESTGATTNKSIACFDRGELEQSIQRFTNSVYGLVEAGDERGIILKSYIDWYVSIHNF